MDRELHILILEDVSTDAELAERELRKANIRFCSKRVETRESFLKELKDFESDLILADYRLPSFDGLSALALAQERCPDVPFIFVSGVLGEELAIETLKGGATDYVLKDRLSRLAPSVRRALREAEERTARKRAEETLQALYRASLQIQEPLGLQERLDRLLQTARDVLGLERLSIFLADSAGQWLQVVASTKAEEGQHAPAIPIGPEGGGLAQAYWTQQMVVWDGQSQVPDALRLQPPYDQIKSLRSRIFALVPLVVQGRAIGVLGADLKHSGRPIDAPTMEILQLFATQAALAIEQARLYESQRMAAIQLEATVEARTRELQAANVRLEAASRHKSEFLANMSHELRTPLNSILGFSQVLAQQGSGPLTEKQARYVDSIHKSGQHLLALISDLLDLSKVEAGKLELRPVAFDLCEAVEAALHDLRPQADAKGVVLEPRIAAALPPLSADPIRVKQVLYNLLSNAVKFTPTGGRIAVTVRRVHSSEFTVERAERPGRELSSVDRGQPAEFMEIAVQDTGIGIKSEDLPRLFQVFTQLEPTITKRYQGTGLGLALTKQLVQLHDGQLWADSKGEGLGSTFTVRLPLTPSG